jgi:ketosteroid isomerase-like protein
MPDNTEANKAVAREFFAHLNAGRIDEGLGLFGETGEWWVAGENGPGSSKGMRDIAEQFRWVLTGPGKGVQFTERGIVAEGDQVVFEAVASGLLTSGNEYQNRYCFILTIRDGEIVGAHEYMDTAHAARAFSESTT